MNLPNGQWRQRMVLHTFVICNSKTKCIFTQVMTTSMISYLLVYPVPVIGTGFPVIRSQHWPAVSACFISNKTDTARLIVNSPGDRMGNVPWTNIGLREWLWVWIQLWSNYPLHFFLHFYFLLRKTTGYGFHAFLTCISLLLLLIQCKISLYLGRLVSLCSLGSVSVRVLKLLLLLTFGCNISQRQIIFTIVYILLFFVCYYITIYSWQKLFYNICLDT